MLCLAGRAARAALSSGSSGGAWRRPLVPARALSAAAVEASTDAERAIAAKIAEGMRCSAVRVSDTSGGCGAMYSIEVVSDEFKGLSIVKQHQLVTRLLKADIAEWHGFHLTTKAP
ncbi:BOL3 [Scenedesmus sp. PABB004]|nr:BOL3 [Scenedesmus sp. PABB004]